MRRLRIYATPDDESHFADVDVGCASTSSVSSGSKFANSTRRRHRKWQD
jgi:hypothetical protein